MNLESRILSKHNSDSYTKDKDLIDDLEKLLNEIGSSYSNISRISELQWIWSSIIRWESFLRSRFNVSINTKLPSIQGLPPLDDDINEKNLAKYHSERLEQLISIAKEESYDAHKEISKKLDIHLEKVEKKVESIFLLVDKFNIEEKVAFTLPASYDITQAEKKYRGTLISSKTIYSTDKQLEEENNSPSDNC